MKESRPTNLRNIIFTIWLNWTISTGAITLPILLSIWVPMPWIPVISLLLMLAMITYKRTALAMQLTMSYRMAAISFRTLLISSIIMEGILIAYNHGIVSQFFEEEALNAELPYLPILIFAPVMLMLSIYYKLRGRNVALYHRIVDVFGTYIERGFVGNLIYDEGNYQLTCSINMSLVATVLSVFYYLAFYINVNINSADAFFLGWLPFIGYLLVVGFMAVRYVSIWGYYSQDIEGSEARMGDKTWLRYLVMCNDSIYLARNEEFMDIPGMDKIDTPASLTIPYHEKISKKYASEVFGNICTLEPDKFMVRFMYLSCEAEGMSNIYHFIVTVKEPETISNSTLDGKWFSISQLQRLLDNRDVSLMLAAEIHRLYTISMAWKTYDRDGNRLNKIKNYRPRFRFNGIDDWDVDFNDPHWLRVARFNEDKPFFRIRRWFKRLTGEY